MNDAVQTHANTVSDEILTNAEHRHIIVPVTQAPRFLAAVVQDLTPNKSR